MYEPILGPRPALMEGESEARAKAKREVRKGKAMLMTFLISSVAHEVVMGVLFRKMRGFLFISQMSQVGLVQVGRLLRAEMKKRGLWEGKEGWGNTVEEVEGWMFWLGILAGPSLLCAAYTVF